ncbi:hypothetical protein [Metallosphaera javensis (ex Sakai et al. 2022)]|uniref:hypothetical protein n=1 Tax=Metallosphaera javensis (ex Sakai et al. 2022) TaxID=2775498 RepID=UPI002588F70D|nr:MAG: hypothetical protein MjAS7_0032 [Metallosphaera javensis (ex Sakai et al. 2022)]
MNAQDIQPQYVVMSVPQIQDMPSRKILFLLIPVVVRERVEGRLPCGFIFKLLIVILFTCSLRDRGKPCEQGRGGQALRERAWGR